MQFVFVLRQRVCMIYRRQAQNLYVLLGTAPPKWQRSKKPVLYKFKKKIFLWLVDLDSLLEL
jgi:hypothetical protein